MEYSITAILKRRGMTINVGRKGPGFMFKSCQGHVMDKGSKGVLMKPILPSLSGVANADGIPGK